MAGHGKPEQESKLCRMQDWLPEQASYVDVYVGVRQPHAPNSLL